MAPVKPRRIRTIPVLTESTMPRVLVIHGAGMNMRGKVQVDIFGPMTLPEYDERIRGYAKELGVEVELFHSNIEGEIVNRLYAANDEGFVFLTRPSENRRASMDSPPGRGGALSRRAPSRRAGRRARRRPATLSAARRGAASRCPTRK